jgi:hypothetical protein
MKFLLVASTVFALDQIKTCIQLKKDNLVCDAHEQCKSDRCNNGICVALPKENESCGEDFFCGPNLGCDGQVCQKLPKEGEDCLFSMDGLNLCGRMFGQYFNMQVGPKLLCYDGKCRRPSTQSQRCSDDKKCKTDEQCVTPAGSSASICVKKYKKGEKCTDSDSCQTGLYCDGKCKKLKSKGSKCAEGQCKKGYECLENRNIITKLYKPKKCQKLPKKGKRCTEKCAKGLYCGVEDGERNVSNPGEFSKWNLPKTNAENVSDEVFVPESENVDNPQPSSSLDEPDNFDQNSSILSDGLEQLNRPISSILFDDLQDRMNSNTNFPFDGLENNQNRAAEPVRFPDLI